MSKKIWYPINQEISWILHSKKLCIWDITGVIWRQLEYKKCFIWSTLIKNRYTEKHVVLGAFSSWSCLWFPANWKQVGSQAIADFIPSVLREIKLIICSYKLCVHTIFILIVQFKRKKTTQIIQQTNPTWLISFI